MAETTMTAMMIANANGDGADGGREIKKMKDRRTE